MSDLYERAVRARDELEAVTSRINPVIARAEAVFVKLGLTHEATVFLERAAPRRVRKGVKGERHHSLRSLCFRQVRGSWRMVIETCADFPGAEPSEALLETSSRHLRLLALQAIPELHRALEAASSESGPG